MQRIAELFRRKSAKARSLSRCYCSTLRQMCLASASRFLAASVRCRSCLFAKLQSSPRPRRPRLPFSAAANLIFSHAITFNAPLMGVLLMLEPTDRRTFHRRRRDRGRQTQRRGLHGVCGNCRRQHRRRQRHAAFGEPAAQLFHRAGHALFGGVFARAQRRADFAPAFLLPSKYVASTTAWRSAALNPASASSSSGMMCGQAVFGREWRRRRRLHRSRRFACGPPVRGGRGGFRCGCRSTP